MQKLPGLSDPGLGRVVCLFWCLFIFNLNADAQTPASNGVGELLKGLKTGEWKFYYPSGKLMAIEMYKEGMLHGKSTAYFPDGAIASVENWQDDLQEDSAWYYHPNGKLFRKGVYDRGVYEGEWLTYFENGKPEQACEYINGLPHGRCQNWYESGEKQETGYYSGGKKEGQFVFYNQGNPRPSLVACYRNDVATGLWIYFTRRGKIDRLEQH